MNLSSKLTFSLKGAFIAFFTFINYKENVGLGVFT